MTLIEKITSFFENKSILILGYGREGQSTYNFIKKYLPFTTLAIADKNKPDSDDTVYFGGNYLDKINDYDIIIKSPGISFEGIKYDRVGGIITSQTDILLKFNKKNMIGITGTKGKSTTSSLIYAIFNEAGFDCSFIGNIGIPPFDCLSNINENTVLICEMSSHQLEHVKNSPHIAVLLNIFEEHLDHYKSYKEYQLAKVNIFKFQDKDDEVVFNEENEIVNKYINKFACGKKIGFPYEINLESNLAGEHNKRNIMAAVAVARVYEISEETIKRAVTGFKGLPHRMEFVGEIGGVEYYDDSIATIPEATIMAIEGLRDVDTIIIGGMDRGINYDGLVEYLEKGKVRNVILMCETGEKIYKKIKYEGAKLVKDLEEAVLTAKKVTERGRSCVLSPAAASYGYFKNFEERGNKFQEEVRKV